MDQATAVSVDVSCVCLEARKNVPRVLETYLPREIETLSFERFTCTGTHGFPRPRKYLASKILH